MRSPKRTLAGRLHLGKANARETAILDQFTKQIATVVWDFSKDGGTGEPGYPAGTFNFQQALPAGAVVTNIYADEQIAVTGATSMTLKAGNTTLSGPLNFTGTSGVDEYALYGNATAIQPSTASTTQLNLLISGAAATAGRVRFAIEFWMYVYDATDTDLADNAAIAQSLIDSLLGASSNYEVRAGSAVTNTGSSVVTGDIGAATAPTGFPPGVVNGTIHTADASYTAAGVAIVAAQAAIGAMVTTGDLTGQDLGTVGLLGPGVYAFSTSAGLTGQLTLDAGGNPNAQFVFKIGTTLTTATSSSVVLANGALADNVVWKVGSSATIGTSTTFKGSIIADTAITMNTSANIDGKLLTRTAAITLDTNIAHSDPV